MSKDKGKGPQVKIYCNKTDTSINKLPCPAGSIVESILEQKLDNPESSGPLLGECIVSLEKVQKARDSQRNRAREAYTTECDGCILNPYSAKR